MLQTFRVDICFISGVEPSYFFIARTYKTWIQRRTLFIEMSDVYSHACEKKCCSFVYLENNEMRNFQIEYYDDLKYYAILVVAVEWGGIQSRCISCPPSPICPFYLRNVPKPLKEANTGSAQNTCAEPFRILVSINVKRRYGGLLF